MPPVIAAITAAAAQIGAFLSAPAVIGLTYGQVLALGFMVYGQVKQRRMEKAARNAYNDRLTDRTVTYSDADAPWQIVYGRATVGGRIVAQLTSGDRDQYQHLVVVWADHESDAIEALLLNGVPVGTLDSNGNATAGRWYKSDQVVSTVTVTLDGAGSATLPQAPGTVLALSYGNGYSGDAAGDVVLDGASVGVSGSTITVAAPHVADWAGRTVQVSFSVVAGTSMLRVKHYLDAPGQVADPTLIAECPGDWSSTDVLTGKTYSIIRYCLDEPEFQSGPQRPTVILRGKKLYDPRTGTTSWSENPALAVADFLRGEYGKEQPAAAVLYDTVAAAANVCDEELARVITGSGTPLVSRRFTCNGAFTTDADPDDTLNALCLAMAGFATYTGGWHVQAGAYTAPVMALSDADNDGSVRVLPAADGQQMVNGMRGQFYDGGRFGARTDYTPYRNAAFLAADGGEEWGTLNLPFTESNHRCAQIARIEVERRRGMQIVYPAKGRAARLRIGQRLTLSCAALNLVSATFRVVNKQFVLGGPVLLTLAQDAASFYDLEDAPADLVSPTAPFLDPFVVPPVTSWTVQSSEAYALRDGDGTVISRARASWAFDGNPYVQQGGALQIEYRLANDTAWTRAPEESPASGQTHLRGLLDNRLYVLRARYRNALGATGAWAVTEVHTVVPSTVAGGPANRLPGQNLLPVADWVPGDAWLGPAAVGAAWVLNAGSAAPAGPAHDVLMSTGPDGLPAVVLRATSGTAFGQQGGWTRQPGDAVDSARPYRLSVWLRVSGDTSGSYYLGTLNTRDIGAGAPNGNPYFLSGLRSALTPGRWYLLAGYVMPAGHPGPPTGLSGVWDAETGLKVFSGTDQRWETSAETAGWRVYQYYTTAAGAVTDLAWPAVHLVDGTEPSIASMLASARAAAARAVADSALGSAAAANTELGKIASDNILTRGEKPQVILDASAIDAERPGILARASGYGITTERTAYDDAVTGLFSYLAGLSPDYDDVSQDTSIVGSTFRLNFGTVYATRQALLDKIAELAGTTAVWSSVSGTGKPADNATKNTVTYSATAPGSPGNGDVWVDTSTTPHTTKLRVAGAWQVGANLSTGALAQLDSVATAQIAAGAVHDIVVLYDAAGYFESNAS